MFPAKPLESHEIVTLIHYISPEIQLLPPHLVASELAFRQSCLKLTPDDPAYLIWPSADDPQHVVDALESFQRRPIEDLSLDFRIAYTADDSLFAHVELTNELRLVFQWEEATWKCFNFCRMPFPLDSAPRLEHLPVDDDEIDSGEDSPDSYWDSYGGAAADRETDAAEFEREEANEGNGLSSYWGLYDSVEDSVIPSPPQEKQWLDVDPISFSFAELHPATDPIESLSDRLEALSQRSLASDDERTIAVVNGASEVALKESLRGVWKLWRSNRAMPTAADQELFLSVVHEVLGEP